MSKPATTAAVMTALHRLALSAGVPLSMRQADRSWGPGLGYDEFDRHRGTFRLVYRAPSGRIYEPLAPVRATVYIVETAADLVAFFAGRTIDAATAAR